MLTYDEFDELSIKEQVNYFKDLDIDFIVENSAEKVYFKEKEESGDMLVCFFDNNRSEWAILKKLSTLGKYINAEYKVINANGSYDEEARLLPIKKVYANTLFKDYNREAIILNKFTKEG